MKNYIKPEIEVLNFQAETVMLDTFDLTSNQVSGGYDDRPNN